MDRGDPLGAFQGILNRVAETGHREEVDRSRVPEVGAWSRLDGRGCTISVEHGRWWVVPPAAPTPRQPAA